MTVEVNLTPDFMSKLKEAIFGHHRGSATAKNAESADFLVKMNLPPLLGRRDAAYEKLEHDIATELPEDNPEQRQEIYRRWLRLLDTAIRDTRAVVVTLSNADTSLRERRLLGYLELLADSLTMAASLTAYEQRIFDPEASLEGFFVGDRGTRLKRRAANFSDCEKRLLANARDLVQMAHTGVKRHRDYTRKNFNSHNAARYHRAFVDFSGNAPATLQN